MRKSNISNKSLNESPRQSRKSDILCPYLLRRGWCKKSNRCDYSHQCIGRQTRVTPKSEVPCPFLKNRGYCLKETRCDFLHPIKHQPSTQPNVMPPHIPTYHHGPLFEPHMRRDTRSPFLFRSPWPVAPPFLPSTHERSHLASADILNNSTIYPKDYGKGITLTVLNTQSLNNKAAIFIDFICEYQPDLLAATETWFIDGESASKTQCTPGGYRFFDHSRSGRRGGGTGLLFKNNLMVSKVTGGEHQSFEYSEWKVTSGSRRVNLIIMYRPPYSAAHPVTSAVFFVEFAEYLESIVLSADPLLIVGDFNIHIDSNENYDAIKFSELLQSFSLTQHVQVPTHSSGHTLDLIITRKTDDLVSSVPRAGCLFSDHMPVFCELDMGKVHFTKSNVSYRNLSAINLDALRADLSNSDLCKNTDLSDIHELAKSYNETLESVINRHAPLRTKTIVARPYVPWFNNEVKSVKRERRRAERKWRRTRQRCDFQIYKSRKNYMIFVMNRSRKKYFTDFVLEHGSDQRKLFNAAKSLFHQRNDLNFPAYDDQIMLANDIGEFFVQKVENIRNELDLSASDLHDRVFDELVALNASFDSFKQLDEEDVKHLIAKSNRKTSSLDPMPTSIVVQCQDILLPVLTRMINISLNSGVFFFYLASPQGQGHHNSVSQLLWARIT